MPTHIHTHALSLPTRKPTRMRAHCNSTYLRSMFFCFQNIFSRGVGRGRNYVGGIKRKLGFHLSVYDVIVPDARLCPPVSSLMPQETEGSPQQRDRRKPRPEPQTDRNTRPIHIRYYRSRAVYARAGPMRFEPSQAPAGKEGYKPPFHIGSFLHNATISEQRS